MTSKRSITRAWVHRPRYGAGPWRRAGPDEDPFTLTVLAAEALVSGPGDGSTVPLRRIHAVGGAAELLDESLKSALGQEEFELRRYPGSSDGALSALEAALHLPGVGGVDLIVGVDHPNDLREERGSAIAGLRVEENPGLELGRHLRLSGSHGSALAPATVLHRAESSFAPPAGMYDAFWLGFSGEVPATWLELGAGRTRPGGWEALAPPPDLGAAPSTSLLDLVARAWRGWRSGARGVVGTVSPSSATLVELHANASEPPDGELLPGEPDPPIALPSDRGDMGPDLGAVSEGAYVPRATYLANLSARWRLVGERCGHCEEVGFPPRGRCRRCGQEDRLTPYPLPRHDLPVATVTTIAPGAQPTEFDFQVDRLGAYSVVIVEAAPGVRVTAQVTDALPGTVAIGDKVNFELRRIYPMEGEWRYGLKAVPARKKGRPPRG